MNRSSNLVQTQLQKNSNFHCVGFTPLGMHLLQAA